LLEHHAVAGAVLGESEALKRVFKKAKLELTDTDPDEELLGR
jgi:hypothetical protein